MYSVTQQCDGDFGFSSRALRCGENGEEEMSVAEERFNGSVTSSRNQRSWAQERQRGKKCRHPFLTSSSLVSLPFSSSYSSIPYTHEGEGDYVLVGDLSGSRLSPPGSPLAPFASFRIRVFHLILSSSVALLLSCPRILKGGKKGGQEERIWNRQQ